MVTEPAADWILKPYTPSRDTRPQRRARRWIVAALVVFCLLYGMAFALLAPLQIIMFFVPPALILMVCIWALPQTNRIPVKAIEFLFFAFIMTLILWPDYLAVAIPGLPWITLVRLASAPLVLAFLIALSSSATFRTQLLAVCASSRGIVMLLCGFVVIQIVTLPLSKHLFGSLNKFVNSEISWTAMFFVSCWIFARPRRAETWVIVFSAMTIPIGLIAIAEFKMHHVPWANYIPSFLKIQDESVLRTLKGGMRAFTGRYRAQSTFTTSLGLAEYVAMTAPFALHLGTSDYARPVKILAWVVLPVILITAVLTNARLGSIGLLAGLAIYVFARACYELKRGKLRILASVVIYSYPAVLAVVLGLTFFVGRLHRLVWGGAETQASTDGRHAQMLAAIPKIAKNPIGHGVGEAAATLGFVDPNGLLTIDSYFLSVALEYGVIGFLVYYGMFALGAFRGIWISYRAAPRERELLLMLPAGVSLIVFILIKAVFSEEGNNSIAFILLGMICALTYRAGPTAQTLPKQGSALSTR